MSVNDRYVPVLPGTGGGTTRGLVEGHGRSLVTQIGQETPRVPHHHASHGPPPPRGRIVRSPPQSRRSIRRPRLVDLVDPFGEEARFAGRPAGGGGGGFADRLAQDLACVARKGCGYGQRGSVRVDRGGSRSLKKNKKT